MICGHSPEYPWRNKPAECSQLAVHEIANGPNREKALTSWFACLVVCSWCNCHVLTDKKEWPQARQLLRLMMLDVHNYDLTAFNMLVNPKAPRRIELKDVVSFLDSDRERINDLIDRLRLYRIKPKP